MNESFTTVAKTYTWFHTVQSVEFWSFWSYHMSFLSSYSLLRCHGAVSKAAFRHALNMSRHYPGEMHMRTPMSESDGPETRDHTDFNLQAS